MSGVERLKRKKRVKAMTRKRKEKKPQGTAHPRMEKVKSEKAS